MTSAADGKQLPSTNSARKQFSLSRETSKEGLPIPLTVCRMFSVQGNRIALDELDAFDGTPILDLKPFIPTDAPTQGVRVPAWARGNRPSSP